MTRGVAIAAITVVCLIHAFTPRLGIWLSNGLGAFKLVLLSLVVFTGFAALAGRLTVEPPQNFSSFQGPPLKAESGDKGAAAAAGYALALLQVLYAYSGWENANYVLTEVRDAPKTLRRAAPLAISAVTILYVLANIAYVSVTRPRPRLLLSDPGIQFAAMSKQDMADSGVVVAARFFRNVSCLSFVDGGSSIG